MAARIPVRSSWGAPESSWFARFRPGHAETTGSSAPRASCASRRAGPARGRLRIVRRPAAGHADRRAAGRGRPLPSDASRPRPVRHLAGSRPTVRAHRRTASSDRSAIPSSSEAPGRSPHHGHHAAGVSPCVGRPSADRPPRIHGATCRADRRSDPGPMRRPLDRQARRRDRSDVLPGRRGSDAHAFSA